MRDTAFLESVTNLKASLASLYGREPSTTVANGIAVLLQQGRLFYRAAAESSIEIQPLVVFYGTMAYAKAIIAAKGFHRIATLKQGHGLKLRAETMTSLVATSARIDESGTFPEFVDAVAEASGFRYFDEQTRAQLIPLSTASAASIKGLDVSLEQVLARMPDLSRSFRNTFKKPPSVLEVAPAPYYSHTDRWKLLVFPREPHRDLATLQALVVELQRRFPVLKGWHLMEARCDFNESELEFANLAPVSGSPNLIATGGARISGALPAGKVQFVPPDSTLLSPIARDLGMAALPHFLEPIAGPQAPVHLSVHALGYIGAYILSMLVRYYPETWVHIVRRSVIDGTPADDVALSIVEQFLGIHREMMERLVETMLLSRG